MYGENLDKDTRMWGMLCHLAGLSAFCGIPGPIGSLIVWLVKRDEHPYIDEQGKEAINFQISILIYQLLCIPLFIIIIGFPMFIFLVVAWLILTIIGAIKANDGIGYRYPFTIRFLK